MVEVWKAITSALPGIWKHRRWALLVALLVGILGGTASALLPSSYEATARVHVDTQSILKPLMDGVAVQPNVEQQVAMVARTLVSRPNLRRVMTESNLDANGSIQTDSDVVLDELTRRISLKPAGGTNFYRIEYRNQSQETALKVVQSMMTIFLESTKGNQAKDTRQALKFIEEQIAQSKTRLEATEAALKDFKIKHFNVMPNLAQDNLVRVAEAQRERQQARLELNQAVNARNAIQRRLANVPPSFSSADPGAASERGVASETETRLRAARSRLDEYLTRFTDAHPDVTNGRRVVRDFEKQLELERAAIRSGTRPANVTVIPNRLFEELSVSLSDADAKVASLTARVADADRAVEVARELSKTVPKVEAEYLQLNRDYAANKASYEVLIARRSSAQMAESMEETSAARVFRVIDPPTVSPKPVWPNRPFLLLATLFASLVAGVAVAFLADRMAPSYFDTDTLRADFGVPVAGLVCVVDSKKTRWANRRIAVGYSLATGAYVMVFMFAIAYFAFGRYLEIDRAVAAPAPTGLLTGGSSR